MKKFIVTVKVMHTEKAEIEAESFEDAEDMLRSGEIEFDVMNDDYMFDEAIEYIGEVK